MAVAIFNKSLKQLVSLGVIGRVELTGDTEAAVLIIVLVKLLDKHDDEYTASLHFKDNNNGHTQRSLSRRISGHIPAWFHKTQRKTLHSSVLENLIDYDHPVNAENNFSVVYRVSTNLVKGVPLQILQTATAIGINIFKPELCVQKKFVQSLEFQWA
ncbi:unnamed protein product [Heterobilharzia americana]|nr:unnamed protein product [Heterobilharzia americana]